MSNAASPLDAAVAALAAGAPLGEHLAADAMSWLMRGEGTPARAAAFLMGLRVRGETAEELAGVVQALRQAMRRVPLPDGTPPIDTCGTGGGTVGTFNISTAAAVVAVGAGARVAKHGNRSYTSRCGSADVLDALGVAVSQHPDGAARMLDRTGLAFLFAPAFHPAMRHLAPVRRELGVTTIMNLAGPLANPASVPRQVVGVADPERAPIVAGALARLHPDHALVVHGRVGMDEIAPHGPTDVWEVRDGRVDCWTVDPAAHGLESGPLDALAGGAPAENASRIVRLFESPADDPVGRAAVVLNAGAAVYVSGLATSFRDGVRRARETLESGAAASALEVMVREAGAALSTSE